MKFVPYVLKHLRATWVRSLSTVLALGIGVLLFCTLDAFLDSLDSSLRSASDARLRTRHAVSLIYRLPGGYGEKIAAVPGVRFVARTNWFGGIFRDAKDYFPNHAVDAQAYLAMHPEYVLSPAEKAAFLEDLRGCIIGPDLARRFGWSPGDVFHLTSLVPAYQRPGPLAFVVRGVYAVDQERHPGTHAGRMLFHTRYLDESTGGAAGAGAYFIEVSDPLRAPQVSAAIDTLFENSDAPTRTETVAAFRAGLVALAGDLAPLLEAVGLAACLTMLVLTGNTMTMSVRERRTEIAVLKVLGFPGALLLALVVGEAAVLGALGGALGVSLSWALLHAGPLLSARLPELVAALVGPDLRLTLASAERGFAAAVGVSAMGALLPAVIAARARIVETLRVV